MLEFPEHYEFRVHINPVRGGESELNLLFSGAASPHPLHRIGPAIHDYILIHTVVSGYGSFETGNRKYRISSGDTFVIFPNVLFSYEADGKQPWTYLWVAVQGRSAMKLLAAAGIGPDQPVFGGAEPGKLAVIYGSIRSSLDNYASDPLADLESGGWLRVLLGEFGRLNAGSLPPSASLVTEAEKAVEQTARWLQTQYVQPISVEQMAHSLGYHRTHLSKIFRRITGLSPMQYLLQIRMERAKELLHTGLTIEQVAASSGYPDPLYFSRQFRKATGLSPTDYRRSLSGSAGSAQNVKPGSDLQQK
ncbi:helix-turn-helix transcriptional regulator [Paenibacillus beijingensis]|uniref:AraC family transcriptional regulator n=1 Tax=Paenibacillus beijingensis TaxID=1126833 RepID=A0A0D5NEL1_9BACL|nr:AraC family transcriptional regulator [Paenibacillus beijingensis]AJY73412.1 AraC family transcriptional regulator [Paenibacillus beijingensis]